MEIKFDKDGMGSPVILKSLSDIDDFKRTVRHIGNSEIDLIQLKFSVKSVDSEQREGDIDLTPGHPSFEPNVDKLDLLKDHFRSNDDSGVFIQVDIRVL